MKAWIGVDLDGTLAHYEGWKGRDHIGEPIPAMMELVKRWLGEGKKIKIFTARACEQDHIPSVKEWLKKNGLPDLEVTNCKDFGMVALYDDRCIQVITNTGQVISV